VLDGTIIRPYADADFDDVIDLWKICFPVLPSHRTYEDDLLMKLSVQRELFFVAIDGDRIVGTAMAGYDGHRGWVYSVGIHPDYRRNGLGRAVMQRVESELLALGCVKLNLQVLESNREVVAFYESLGYKVEPRVSMGKLLGGTHVNPDQE
jgi:ribosomal protein S18 acetylase RimI-like enzyme